MTKPSMFFVLFIVSDGLISYDELLAYFESANSQLRERFTHQFVEHTFIGTPVCEHCKGMVRSTHSVTSDDMVCVGGPVCVVGV